VAPPEAEAVDVPMVIGACYMLSRASYRRLGGFSPMFRIWGLDEQDLSLRACLSGIPVRCVTTARVGHLSRNAFPYPVFFEHLEFNQLMMIRSVFEEETIQRLEPFFAPLPPTVKEWLEKTDVQAWRAEVQAGRVRSDEELLEQVKLTLPELL
jgi:N-terminal domain of galactosyltransferase